MSVLTVSSTYSGRWGKWGTGDWNEWLSQTQASGSNGEINGQVTHGGGENQDKWDVKIGFAQFDTSALPNDCTITSAYLRVFIGYSFRFSSVGAAISTMAVGNITDGALDEYTTGNILSTDSDQSDNIHFLTITNPNTNISKTGWTKYHFGTQQSMNRQSPGNSAPYPGEDTYYILGNDSGDNNIKIVITYTTPPAVTTGDSTNVAGPTATLGGNVTDDGGGTISERGVCWSLSANPTVSDSKATAVGTTGAYTVSATGLLVGKVYHYRAYVTTENSTAYGSGATFITPSGGFFAIL